jgi:hypothetical protein
MNAIPQPVRSVQVDAFNERKDEREVGKSAQRKNKEECAKRSKFSERRKQASKKISIHSPGLECYFSTANSVHQFLTDRMNVERRAWLTRDLVFPFEVKGRKGAL